MKGYIRIKLDDSNKIECPICHRMNNHTTGDVCEHAYKVVINNHKESVAWYKNNSIYSRKQIREEVGNMRTERQKRLDRSWASVQEILKDVTAIDSRCDVLISEIRKPMKSFHVWLFDGLCGRGFQVR